VKRGKDLRTWVFNSRDLRKLVINGRDLRAMMINGRDLRTWVINGRDLRTWMMNCRQIWDCPKGSQELNLIVEFLLLQRGILLSEPAFLLIIKAGRERVI
jgi:hypothetical protein